MIPDSLAMPHSSEEGSSQPVVPGGSPFDRVLLAVDAETDRSVIDTAVSIAAAFDASIHALTVVPMSASVDHWDIVVERRETAAEEALDRVEAAADAVSVTKRLRYGDPAEEIELYAEHNGIDLVVAGEPNRTGLRRFFAPKSVTESLRGSVSLPVLAVPAAEASASDDLVSSESWSPDTPMPSDD